MTTIQKEDDISITLTKSYYQKLMANAWAVDRLKKHIRVCDDREFYNRAASILIGTLENKMNIKDFGKEQDEHKNR